MGLRIGQNIKKIRELRNYDQTYMAERLSIAQRTYSDIENDKINIDNDRLKNIATILEVDPITLVTFDERILFKESPQSGLFNTYHTSSKETELYERQIKSLQEQIKFMKEEIIFLRSKFDGDTNSDN